MKKAIELLESLRGNLLCINAADVSERRRRKAIGLVDDAIAILKALPRWETPEQWEKRTGEPWTDDWAVYYRVMRKNGEYVYYWSVSTLWEALIKKSHFGGGECKTDIICATEAGPPPDNWKPEKP